MSNTATAAEIPNIVSKTRRRRRLPLPLTFEERAEMGKAEVRVPATFEEYLELSADCNYRVFYRNGEIISFIEIDETTKTIMGEATVTHERMVARLIFFLSQILGFDSNFQIMGSNAKIFIAEDRKGFNADIVVVEGAVEQKEFKPNKRTSKGICNPTIIVEVLSKSTRQFDMTEKLEDYKKMPSLKQIIYFDQASVAATTYIRKGKNEWLNIDYNELSDKIPVENGFIELEKVYSKIFE